MTVELLAAAKARLGPGAPAAQSLEARAYQFADAAHQARDHRRRNGAPYIVHLAEVAALVRQVAHSTEQLAASWLHDILEDTDTTAETLSLLFGDLVARLVDELTDVSKPEDGSRVVRKAIDRRHTAEASADAQTIKAADIASNCRDVAQIDPAFARIYLEEKRLQLQLLDRADQHLVALAATRIEAGMRYLTHC